MNPLIKELELSIPTTEHSLAEAKRLCDAPAVIKFARLLRNESTLLGLLRAKKAKRLGEAEMEFRLTLPEM